jgi:hypothetical protein
MTKKMKIAAVMLEHNAHLRGGHEDGYDEASTESTQHSSASGVAFCPKVTFIILFFFS